MMIGLTKSLVRTILSSDSKSKSQNLIWDICENSCDGRFSSRVIRQDHVLHYRFEFDFCLVVMFAEKKIIKIFEIIRCFYIFKEVLAWICRFHMLHFIYYWRDSNSPCIELIMLYNSRFWVDFWSRALYAAFNALLSSSLSLLFPASFY